VQAKFLGHPVILSLTPAPLPKGRGKKGEGGLAIIEASRRANTEWHIREEEMWRNMM